MAYVICSRGRRIGTSDLAYPVPDPSESRMGTLEPEPGAEEVLDAFRELFAIVMEMGGAARAGSAAGLSPTSPMFDRMRTALERVQALELTVHDEKGALIPASAVQIQDTEAILEVGRAAMEALGDAPWDPEVEGAADEDAALWLEERDRSRDAEAVSHDWEPARDDDDAPLPRYQVSVMFGPPA